MFGFAFFGGSSGFSVGVASVLGSKSSSLSVPNFSLYCSKRNFKPSNDFWACSIWFKIVSLASLAAVAAWSFSSLRSEANSLTFSTILWAVSRVFLVSSIILLFSMSFASFSTFFTFSSIILSRSAASFAMFS